MALLERLTTLCRGHALHEETATHDGVRAVGRALDIVLAFTAHDLELSATDLLKRVPLSRPTLYRLLHTLEEKGFIVALGEPQRFRLGPAIANLTRVWTSTFDVSAVADPIMKKAWTETGETVALFVPRGNQRLCVAELPSEQVLSFRRGVGYLEPLPRGASGKAILAFMDLPANEIGLYAQGIAVEPSQLSIELARTRKTHFAMSRGDIVPGAIGIAAPFFDRTGNVAGSIAVFGPEFRIDSGARKELCTKVVRYGEELSTALR